MTTQNLKKTKNPKLVLLLLMIILLGPFGFAVMLIQKGNTHQFRLSNHGDLITPPKDIHSIATMQNQKLDGKWWLVYVPSDKCELACEDVLYDMRQIKTALGKNSERLGKLIITQGNCNKYCDPQLKQNKSKLVKVKLSTQEHSALFNSTADGLYIIDPRGYLMMHYEIDTPPKDILTDLKRLLKISKIG